MLLNAYLICLRCTRGRTIKMKVRLGGTTPDGKIHFPLMTKGERFIRCRGNRHGSKWSNGHRDAENKGMFPGGSMSDMTCVLHDMILVLHQSVAINEKGGYC